MIEASQRRKNIREILELLASEERQLPYERDVPHVDVTREFVSMWFDDEYHSDDPSLVLAFAAEELAALDRFHRFYDSRVDELPESKGTVRTWLACSHWREVMTHAQRTLEKIA